MGVLSTNYRRIKGNKGHRIVHVTLSAVDYAVTGQNVAEDRWSVFESSHAGLSDDCARVLSETQVHGCQRRRSGWLYSAMKLMRTPLQVENFSGSIFQREITNADARTCTRVAIILSRRSTDRRMVQWKTTVSYTHLDVYKRQS